MIIIQIVYNGYVQVQIIIYNYYADLILLLNKALRCKTLGRNKINGHTHPKDTINYQHLEKG